MQAKRLSVRSGRRVKHCLGSDPGETVATTHSRRAWDITVVVRGVCAWALEPRSLSEGSRGTCCDRQPDSGNPTVRDERGARGNVAMVER
jgi:hypothetical protein